MNLFDSGTFKLLGGSGPEPVFEFAAIAFVTMLTYLGTHAAFGRVKPATKALISMFLGVTAYNIGKFVLLLILAKPVVGNL